MVPKVFEPLKFYCNNLSRNVCLLNLNRGAIVVPLTVFEMVRKSLAVKAPELYQRCKRLNPNYYETFTFYEKMWVYLHILIRMHIQWD